MHDVIVYVQTVLKIYFYSNSQEFLFLKKFFVILEVSQNKIGISEFSK